VKLVAVYGEMAGLLYHMHLPAPILRQEFWLYVWKVGLPDGKPVHYVGMTGDTGTRHAQSAMNRVAAHLGRNVHSNALRRYLRDRRRVELESCASLDFYAFGPVYPRPEKENYAVQRGRVAALEKQLWLGLGAAGYDMLNREPQATAALDELTWPTVCKAFQSPFPNLE